MNDMVYDIHIFMTCAIYIIIDHNEDKVMRDFI